MNAKQLNYSRLNLIGKSCEPRVTQENMASALDRTASGFRKAIKAGTIYAHEILTLAELFQMTEEDLFKELSKKSNSVGEELPSYIKKKRLSDVSDPLDWLRLAMSKSSRLDKLIESVKD